MHIHVFTTMSLYSTIDCIIVRLCIVCAYMYIHCCVLPHVLSYCVVVSVLISTKQYLVL